MFAGSTVFIGSEQIYNKQYWKLPIIYGGIGTTLGLGIHYNSKYRHSKKGYDIAMALDPNMEFELDTRSKDMAKYMFASAVIAAILRIERQHIGHVVRRLARRDADLLDFGRQGRRRGRGVVLHFDGVHVAVRARLEHDLQAVAARVIGVRGHIVHALRAVDLLLDDLRDRIIDDGRRSARVRRRDGNGRRRNLRVLRNWQLRRGNRADDDDDQRDDDRENRAMNEEF